MVRGYSDGHLKHSIEKLQRDVGLEGFGLYESGDVIPFFQWNKFTDADVILGSSSYTYLDNHISGMAHVPNISDEGEIVYRITGYIIPGTDEVVEIALRNLDQGLLSQASESSENTEGMLDSGWFTYDPNNPNFRFTIQARSFDGTNDSLITEMSVMQGVRL